ncbi:hypothetical protein [Mandarin fish ranavirus]|nr:hypothetical protein [Mandarin fish ranavirus]
MCLFFNLLRFRRWIVGKHYGRTRESRSGQTGSHRSPLDCVCQCRVFVGPNVKICRCVCERNVYGDPRSGLSLLPFGRLDGKFPYRARDWRVLVHPHVPV